MSKKLLVPTLILAMSAFAGVGCRDNSGDAIPFPDAGGLDGSELEDATTDSADAPSTGDAPASDAAPTDGGGDATTDAPHG